MIEECVIQADYRFLGELNVQIILVCSFLSVLIKDWKHACFCVTLFTFYSFAVQFHCDFKAIDPERVVRYLIWTGIDLIFLMALFVLWKLKMVKHWLLVACAALEFIAVLMHLIRLNDIHSDLVLFTSSYYSPVIVWTNMGFVSLAVAPVLLSLLKKGIKA